MVELILSKVALILTKVTIIACCLSSWTCGHTTLRGVILIERRTIFNAVSRCNVGVRVVRTYGDTAHGEIIPEEAVRTRRDTHPLSGICIIDPHIVGRGAVLHALEVS